MYVCCIVKNKFKNIFGRENLFWSWLRKRLLIIRIGIARKVPGTWLSDWHTFFSFNPLDNPEILFLWFPFYREGNWSSERLRNLLKSRSSLGFQSPPACLSPFLYLPSLQDSHTSSCDFSPHHIFSEALLTLVFPPRGHPFLGVLFWGTALA